MSDVTLKVENLDNHSAKFLNLSKTEYGNEAEVSSPHYFNKKHLNNPVGDSIILSLSKGDKNIGRLILLRRNFYWNLETLSCCFPTDFLIDAEYRGLDSVLQLLNGFKKFKKNYGFSCVTPNKNALNVWRKLSGLRDSAELVVSAMPLRVFKLLFKSQQIGLTGSISKFFDRSYSLLVLTITWLSGIFSQYGCSVCEAENLPLSDINLFFEKDEIRGDRSQSIVNWRTSFRIKTNYHYLLVKRKNVVVGYGIFAEPEDYDGLSPLVLMDLVSVPADRVDVTRALGRWGVIEGYKRKKDLILFMGIIPNSKSSHMTHFPFILIPKSFLPDANEAFLDLNGLPKGDKALYLTLFDCDMF